MFNKYKEQFIKWIEDKIGIGELRRNSLRMKNDITNLKSDISTHKKTMSSQSKVIEEMQKRLDVLMNLVDVGMDVNLVRHGSWAVVCLKGKSNYIKFAPIDETSINEMVAFLEKYNGANIIVDAPMGVSNVITSTKITSRNR